MIVAQPSPLPVILNVALVNAFTESGTVTIDVLLLDSFHAVGMVVTVPAAVRSGEVIVSVLVSVASDNPGNGRTWSGTFIVNAVVADVG